MKSLTKLLAAVAAFPLLVACQNEGDTYSGIIGGNANNGQTPYANTAYAYIGFGSYGSWHIEAGSASEWCTFAATSGKGGMFYTIPVRLSQNTTGSARSSLVTVRDDENGGDVYWTFRLGQYATRGDGSLGSAPLVTGIIGDDGSNIGVGSLVKRLRDKQEAERRRKKHSKKKDRQQVEDDTFDDGYTPDEADVKVGDKEEQAFEYKNVVSLQSVVDGTAGVDQQQPQRNLLMYLRSVRDIDKEIGIAYLDVVDFDPSILDLE